MGFERFCVKCGVVTDSLIKESVKNVLERNELFEVRDVNIELCVKCGKMRIKSKWGAYNLEAIGEEVSKKVHLLINLEPPKINISLEPITETDFDAEIKVSGFLEGVLVEETKHHSFSLNKVSCDPCMKLVSNYRESIIQLRAGSLSESEYMFDVAKNFLSEEQAVDSLSAIVKTVKSPNGFDLWIGSNKGAYRVVRKLEKLFKIKAITSKKLIGEDRSGKVKYRFTYCLKKK